MLNSTANTLDRPAVLTQEGGHGSGITGRDSRELLFWRYVTHLGSAPATLSPGVALFVLGGYERQIGIALLLINVISHLIAQLLKRTVVRPRPCDAAGRSLALIDVPDEYSFPSGHATAAAAVAVTLTLAYGWPAPALLPLAAVVAASRAKLGVHYGSDAAAGMFLGLATAITLFPLLI